MTEIALATDLRTTRERIIRSHIEAECHHDIEATLATFADANYDVVPLGAPTNGASAVDELLQMLFTAFPDFHCDPLAIHHSDDIVLVDCRISGTHRGVWAGIPATGRAVAVRCACVFHFDADRLVKETVFFDHATLLAQIGVGS